MTARFFKSAGWLGVQSRGLSLLIALALAQVSVRGADLFWTNSSTVTVPPQIDAINFVNYGTIDFGNAVFPSQAMITDPFETSDTLNYTNYGFMSCSPGWRFDNAPASIGTRKASATFVNKNSGVIQSLDPTVGMFVLGQANLGTVFPSYLWVDATNIINAGLLSVGANGWMKLAGTNVNLKYGGLEVAPVAPVGSFNAISNFFPDVAIRDIYWGGTNTAFVSSQIWTPPLASTPVHNVSDRSGFNFNTAFTIFATVADSYSNAWGSMVQVTNLVAPTNLVVTNIFFPTNIFKQAVFVSFADTTNLMAAVKYMDSSNPTNGLKTVAVELAFMVTNEVTFTPDLLTLFFYDTLASETNRGPLLNVVDGFSMRPANYVVSRIDDGTFTFGFFSTNGVPDGKFLFDPDTFTNNFVGAEYAAYASFIDNIITEPPAIPAGTVTNLPGRIQVYADSVDLTRSRLRGEGEIIVKAPHLVSSESTFIDCENLSFNLGNTNGTLRVTNLAKESVARLYGNVFQWSGLWSNQMTFVYTNNWTLTNDPVNTNLFIPVQVPLTNTANVNLHAFLIDAFDLHTSKPVLVYDMITHSTNLVVNDRMVLVQSFLDDGLSFTLNGSMTFSNHTFVNTLGFSSRVSLDDWVYTNAPNLLYFTNNGTLTIPIFAHFGDDRPRPYADFVNSGTITSGSINARSDYLRNNGTLRTTFGTLGLNCLNGLLEAGQSSSTGDTFLYADMLKLNQYTLTSSRGLYLYVTNSLSDPGIAGVNSVQVAFGFTMPFKPSHGDLLGTTFQTSAASFAAVEHIWSADDRGANAAGYTDNAAMGVLKFAAPGMLSLYIFEAPTPDAHKALYVDLLDLSNLGRSLDEIEQFLIIDPSIVIYYAAAKLGFQPPPNDSGIPQLPEEFLDGKFDGHLRWVSSFAGPNSSIDTIVNGQTVRVNRALRFSKIIDSNGDGIPNFYDPYPFGAPLKLAGSMSANTTGSGSGFSISWKASPQTAYDVQYTTNLFASAWQTLTSYTNSSTATADVTVKDANAPSAATQRFYRVQVKP